MLQGLAFTVWRMIRGLLPAPIAETLARFFAPGPIPKGAEEILARESLQLLRGVIPEPKWTELAATVLREFDIPDVVVFKTTMRFNLKISPDLAFTIQLQPHMRLSWRAVIFDPLSLQVYIVRSGQPLGRGLTREEFISRLGRAIKSAFPWLSSREITRLLESAYMFIQFYVSYSVPIRG